MPEIFESTSHQTQYDVYDVLWLAVWLSGNALASINVVALRQTRLVPGSTRFRPPSATVVSAEPFSHGPGTLRCLQKEMATYRHWSVSFGETQMMSHIVESCPHDKTEWWLISATLCGWRRCFVDDQVWFMTRLREEGRRSCFFRCDAISRPLLLPFTRYFIILLILCIQGSPDVLSSVFIHQ